MKKKIAVIVRDRQAEALRMAVGLTLEDDEVSVFVMDRRLAADEKIAANLEFLGAMGVKLYSNNSENRMTTMSDEDIARAIVDYDVILPY